MPSSNLLFCGYEVIMMKPGAHNERRKGEGGEEREAPTHLIEISRPARVTKNSKTARYVAKKHLVNAMFVAHSSSVKHNRGFKNRCTNKWSGRTTFQKSASQKTASFVWQGWTIVTIKASQLSEFTGL